MAEEPDEFTAVSNRVWDELVLLADVWTRYVGLYRHSEERLGLLNESARWFFASLRRLLVRDTILSVSRLTDPIDAGGGKSNLVLEALLGDPRFDSRPELKVQVASEIETVKELAKPIRIHRNRSVAHLDHVTALGAADDLLPSLSQKSVDEVITRMQAIYRRYSLELYESDRSFELFALGAVDALIEALENGRRWRQHERAEMKKRYGIPDDL
jgi:hypothetical protein